MKVSISTSETPVTTLSMPPSIPEHFHFLVQILEQSRLAGTEKPLRSWAGIRLKPGTYKQAGVSAFKQYSLAAEKAGLVILGGTQASAWISLSPIWHGKVPPAKSS